MEVFFNLFFLLLGSILMLRQQPELPDLPRPVRGKEQPKTPALPIGWVQHTGLLLLLYGFANALGFLIGFTHRVDAGPLWAAFRMGCWVLLVVIGFTLAYPLLEQHVFGASGEDMRQQGRKVVQGFVAMRWILGLAGLLVSAVLAAFRLGWL